MKIYSGNWKDGETNAQFYFWKISIRNKKTFIEKKKAYNTHIAKQFIHSIDSEWIFSVQFYAWA